MEVIPSVVLGSIPGSTEDDKKGYGSFGMPNMKGLVLEVLG